MWKCILHCLKSLKGHKLTKQGGGGKLCRHKMIKNILCIIPRNICLKRHSFPCKSLATNSCVGGCRDISCYRCKLKTISQSIYPKNGQRTHNNWILLNSGGRHSSACRLKTENPPWVLVSDAVSVLQKECTWNRGGGGRIDSFFTVFSSCYNSHFRTLDKTSTGTSKFKIQIGVHTLFNIRSENWKIKEKS